VPFPFFAIGPGVNLLKWTREWEQKRRKVALTVHVAHEVTGQDAQGQPILGRENYYVGVVNRSRERDIVVTHVWFDTEPPLHINDPDLPRRLAYDARWETPVPTANVAAPRDRAPFLARCQIEPDDKIIKSRPRENVPPFGRVPRG
jgi:hypothetical protein